MLPPCPSRLLSPGVATQSLWNHSWQRRTWPFSLTQGACRRKKQEQPPSAVLGSSFCEDVFVLGTVSSFVCPCKQEIRSLSTCWMYEIVVGSSPAHNQMMWQTLMQITRSHSCPFVPGRLGSPTSGGSCCCVWWLLCSLSPWLELHMYTCYWRCQWHLECSKLLPSDCQRCRWSELSLLLGWQSQGLLPMYIVGCSPPIWGWAGFRKFCLAVMILSAIFV